MSRSRPLPPLAPDAPADSRPVPERILASALQLVQSQGIAALSQARVAAAAGLRQSHLTYYFPTRKDLLLAIVQAIHGEMRQGLGLSGGGAGTAPKTLAQLRAFLVSRVREPLMGRLLLSLMAAADEDPSLRQWLLDFDAEVRGLMRADFLRLGLPPSDAEVAIFSACLLGAGLMGAQADGKAAVAHFENVVGLAFDRLVASCIGPATPKRAK